MKKGRLPFILMGLLIVAQGLNAQSWEKQWQHLLDSVYRVYPGALGIILHVEAPDQNISWTTAVGFADREKTTVLQAEQPVLLASNTKTYVAAAILRLVENGQLQLESGIQNRIHAATRKKLEQQGYALDQITIRDLLAHTSGIRDYVDDAYFDEVIEHPQHQWTRDEQIQRAMDLGESGIGPGTQFSYGDINYLLLGEILETQTEKTFYQAIRTLLQFEQLGLTQTWFKTLEPDPKAMLPFAHQYARDFKWDSDQLNPSWDLYGGGGIAATVKEAALFYQYLFTGQIIKDPTVLKTMHEYVLPPEQSKYALGIYHFNFGYSLYYHGGWWGTDVNYSPETNTTVSICTLVKEERTEINPFLGKKIQEQLNQ